MTEQNWRLNGVCREVDPELFFPNPTDRRGTLDAMAVCFTCPVMAQCRKWAQDTRQEYGVWGGKDFGANPYNIQSIPVPAPAEQPVATGKGSLNANKTHCIRGHELAGDNLREVPLRSGRMGRQCVKCERDRKRSKRAAARALGMAYS